MVQPARSFIEAAARALMRGELVAFPTETVYGLGADAANPAAVARIYKAKGRPSQHPVIVHVACAQDMAAWCGDIPAQAWQLAQAFWPGPLTLILKRHPDVDPGVSGGQLTIGVRCPSHPVAQELLEVFAHFKTQTGESRAGVAAPSANRFGRVSPTSAPHVQQEFADLVAHGMPVLEGGDSEVGIESTIVDLSSVDQGGDVALLRPGAISAEQISAVLKVPVVGHQASSPRVSGALKAHYAPSTPLALCGSDALASRVSAWLSSHEGRLAVIARDRMSSVPPRVVEVLMPGDAGAFGHELYATLRKLDELGVAGALIEQVPDEAAWAGVRDRLTRAAAAFEGDRAAD